MLAERENQLDAEQSSSQTSIWRHVYNLMCCPGPPCHLELYYWRDKAANKHYRLQTYHLRSLIKYVEQGYKLEGPDDVPDEICNQLYAEEQQYLERKRKRDTSSPAHRLTVSPSLACGSGQS